MLSIQSNVLEKEIYSSISEQSFIKSNPHKILVSSTPIVANFKETFILYPQKVGNITTFGKKMNTKYISQKHK